MVEREHFTNGRCLTFGTGFAVMGAAFGAQVSGWTHWVTIGLGYGIGMALMLIATVLVTKSYFSGQAVNSTTSFTQGTVLGIPTLSALLGQNPNIEFDAKKFLALAHYSPLTAEAEKNIKIVAHQNSPNDKEAFYARFIGVGTIAYLHDVTWLTIYGSQMAALAELNSKGLIPLANLKKYYDQALSDYPQVYADYSFEEWVDYMKNRFLTATYPSQMVELSHGGKDFLKYLAHVGRDVHSKRC